jgi:hypothetical protein
VTFGQQVDLWDDLDTLAEPPAPAPTGVVVQPLAPQSSVEIADSASGPRLTIKVYSKDAHEAMQLALVLYAETRHQLGLDDTPQLRVADRR